MVSIFISIVVKGAIYLFVMATFTEILPEAAMPCQKLCHVKINITVSPFSPTLYISDKSMGPSPSPFRRSIPSNLPPVQTLLSFLPSILSCKSFFNNPITPTASYETALKRNKDLDQP